MNVSETEVEILRLLKKSRHAYLSGQEISRRLGVSRSAVWKHIEALRKNGFSIEASPKKGYNLNAPTPFGASDILSELETELVGASIHYFKSIDSTNTKAAELAREGAGEGTCVIAESQSSGRGRLGRSWLSPAGVNLYTSIILRPKLAPNKAQSIALMAAVAVAGTIERYCKANNVTVKWPNDVMIDGRKAAGILIETSSDVDRIKYLILGIGVNLNMNTTEAPDELCDKIASIGCEGTRPVERSEFARRLYSSIEKWYKILLSSGSAPIIDVWRQHFDKEGKKVLIKGPPDVEGICMGVDEDGSLLIRTSDGKTRRVTSGDFVS